MICTVVVVISCIFWSDFCENQIMYRFERKKIKRNKNKVENKITNGIVATQFFSKNIRINIILFLCNYNTDVIAIAISSRYCPFISVYHCADD